MAESQIPRLSNPRAYLRRRLLQSVTVALLGVFALAAPAAADEASCNALIAMQAAYCKERNEGVVVPDFSYGSYDAEHDICTLIGC